MVRPSGTEPKLKCYIEAVGSSAVAAGAPDPPSAERYERTRAELLAVCDELATALALHLGLAGARPAP
jgi:phosphomannomutase